MAKNNLSKRKKILLPVLLVLILAVAGGGYYLWSQQGKTAAAKTTSKTASLQTSIARQGNLTISALGTGTLVSGQKVSLSFSAAGTVGKVNVQIGDKVKEGQVLAEQTAIDTLKASVNSAQLELTSAQQDLETLQKAAASNIANAQLAVTTAQKAYDEAKSGLKVKGVARCTTDETNAYYAKYKKLQDDLQALGDLTGNPSSYLAVYVPLKKQVDQAYASYRYCAEYTTYEIDSSQATISLTEAQLKDAKDALEKLQKNNGLDPLTLAQAQNKIASAQLALEKAQKNLDGASIKAPFAGTILTVAGQAGDSNTTSAFITMADLDRPQVDFYVDETDLDKVTVGLPVQVTFDAAGTTIFNGKVARVNPSLETVSGYSVVKCLAQLSSPVVVDSRQLPLGLTASVEIIGGKTENAVLVPIESLRDLGGGEYGIFVLNAQGKPRFQIVTVGLKDLTTAEIKSGVKVGDVVTTGITELK